MIRNQSERNAAEEQATELEAWLADEPSELNRLSLTSKIEGIREEIRRFDESQLTNRIEFESVEQLLEALVAARYAVGLTQAEMAAELDCAEQQVQRWERDDYQRITAFRLFDIEDALGVRISGSVHIKDRPDSPPATWVAMEPAGTGGIRSGGLVRNS